MENKLKNKEEVTSELGVARVDKHEDNRREKEQEIVENFKRLFPGVFDRLINMSNPIHKKYNVAITKQLGRYMEAIVVDTERTARQCIQYLKDQMLEPETFPPPGLHPGQAAQGEVEEHQQPPWCDVAV